MRRRLVALVLLAALAGLLIWAITRGTLAASTTNYHADAVALSTEPKTSSDDPPAASSIGDPHQRGDRRRDDLIAVAGTHSQGAGGRGIPTPAAVHSCDLIQ